ncbi:MAG: DUF4160 domain-containing protein [Bacteroidales bacterium]|nr:DUF4160 domain-containing protein [Bacteroidales bacterium]
MINICRYKNLSPPLSMHVHVKNGDGKAKIIIENAQVVENNGIKPAD